MRIRIFVILRTHAHLASSPSPSDVDIPHWIALYRTVLHCTGLHCITPPPSLHSKLLPLWFWLRTHTHVWTERLQKKNYGEPIIRTFTVEKHSSISSNYRPPNSSPPYWFDHSYSSMIIDLSSGMQHFFCNTSSPTPFHSWLGLRTLLGICK